MILPIEANWQIVGGVHYLDFGRYEARAVLINGRWSWLAFCHNGGGLRIHTRAFDCGTTSVLETAKERAEDAITRHNLGLYRKGVDA